MKARVPALRCGVATVPLLLLLAAASSAAALTARARTNPVEKAMELLSNLQKRIIAEGETAQSVYDEFAGWCEDRSREIRQSIKTQKAEMENLKAAIEKASDEVEADGTTIEELSTAISADEADLRAATLIREKEAADFQKVQTDLLDTIDMMERSISILERKAKEGASMFQTQGAGGLARALAALVDAGGLSLADGSRLTALVQSAEAAGEGDAVGAPAADEYESKSGSVVETLEGLLDKAQGQLDDTRATETARTGHFEALKQALEEKLATDKAAMDAAKKELAEAGERGATAQGELSVTQKDLKEETASLGELHHNCMSKAADFEEQMKSRGEELNALAAAKKVIAEMTGGAQKVSYGQVSFLQEEAASSEAEQEGGSEAGDGSSADIRAARLVARLARRRGSPAALVALSSRLDATVRAGAVSGEDPFAKVRDLISDMIRQLSEESDSEVQHKAWCDSELHDAQEKKTQKESDLEKVVTEADQLAAGSAGLAEEVSVLQKELAELAKSQSEMEKIRQEEHADFLKSKPEMEDGIKGIKMALKALRDYYGKAEASAGGAGGEGGGASVIGMLEEVESDFSKTLSELVSEEEAAVKVFEEQTKENEMARAVKEQDVKSKTKAAKADDKTATELAADRDSLQAELSAVDEYLKKLQDQCLAKEEPYEVRKKRRDQEIAGLKEALAILQGSAGAGAGGASLLQERASRRLLRGR